jgi:hypothetical protein
MAVVILRCLLEKLKETLDQMVFKENKKIKTIQTDSDPDPSQFRY